MSTWETISIGVRDYRRICGCCRHHRALEARREKSVEAVFEVSASECIRLRCGEQGEKGEIAAKARTVPVRTESVEESRSGRAL